MCPMWSTSWAASMSSPRPWCLVFLWTRPLSFHRSSGMRYVCHKYDTTHVAVYTCTLPKASEARVQIYTRGMSTCSGNDFSLIIWLFLVSLVFFSLSDLWANPNPVPEGALWVQIHADWSKLVQLLFWPTSSQGQHISDHLTFLLYSVFWCGTFFLGESSGRTAGLWSHTRFW